MTRNAGAVAFVVASTAAAGLLGLAGVLALSVPAYTPGDEIGNPTTIPECAQPDEPNCGRANGAGDWEPDPTYTLPTPTSTPDATLSTPEPTPSPSVTVIEHVTDATKDLPEGELG